MIVKNIIKRQRKQKFLSNPSLNFLYKDGVSGFRKHSINLKMFGKSLKRQKLKPRNFDEFERTDIPRDPRMVNIDLKIQRSQEKMIRVAKSLLSQSAKREQDLKQLSSGAVSKANSGSDSGSHGSPNPQKGTELVFDEELGKVVPKSNQDSQLTKNRDSGKPQRAEIMTVASLKSKIMQTKIPEENLSIEAEKVRVSKFLSRASICSRRQAERYIKAGVVKVNGVTLRENMEIDPLKDKVEIFKKNQWEFPVPETTRVWAFYKPRGLLCDRTEDKAKADPRMDIYQYLDGVLGINHFITVVS